MIRGLEERMMKLGPTISKINSTKGVNRVGFSPLSNEVLEVYAIVEVYDEFINKRLEEIEVEFNELHGDDMRISVIQRCLTGGD